MAPDWDSNFLISSSKQITSFMSWPTIVSSSQNASSTWRCDVTPLPIVTPLHTTATLLRKGSCWSA